MSFVRLAHVLLCCAVLQLVTCSLISQARAQGLSTFDRDFAEEMLKAAKDDVKKQYYDVNFRGLDIESRFQAASQRLKQATNRDQLILIVAQALLDMNDSHTFFRPPSRAARVEYGWEMRAIGDKTYVTAVKPKTDAEAKGVKTGDLIVSVDGYAPTRDNLWKIYYRYYTLVPARSIKLVLQSPGGQPRDVEVLSKIEKTAQVVDWEGVYVRYLSEGQDVETDRYVEISDDLFIWQMTSFVKSSDRVEAMMRKAQRFKTLVLDLRGNGGGYVDISEQLVGYFFDREVKIADQKGRKELKPIIAKPRDTQFKGQLIVLIDSDSGSAAEIFARVVQLEKRGKVLGDRSSGMVMTSKHFTHQSGVGSVLYFGTSVAISDVIMTDGKSLEKAGVTPDEHVLMTGADLAAQKDVVISRAAEIAGVQLDAAKAGTFFPKKWRK
jgi:C-terminal processing protease CtpA/Prc